MFFPLVLQYIIYKKTHWLFTHLTLPEHCFVHLESIQKHNFKDNVISVSPFPLSFSALNLANLRDRLRITKATFLVKWVPLCFLFIGSCCGIYPIIMSGFDVGVEVNRGSRFDRNLVLLQKFPCFTCWMPELLLKMSTAAGQLREPLLEVHRVMQVRESPEIPPFYIPVPGMHRGEREAELQGMELGELQCAVAKTFIRIFQVTTCYKQGTVYFFNFICLL